LFRGCEGGGDHENLCQSWAQCRMANSLLLATLFRIGFVVISYGCKVPAGIFVPSMAVGATFGRMVGIIVKAIHRAYPTAGWFAACKPDMPCITPGTYAFLGAAAALGGVMRITVTVVVIMFELTGALTYILPTMIVLLVTKSVGDFFGISGIADETIRFNGYPFLDKEEHAFHISVSQVMRKDLHTLNASGTRVHEIEAKLRDTEVQGFPIVSGDADRTLLGHIGRTELRYVLEKAKRMGTVPPDTPCFFLAESLLRSVASPSLIPDTAMEGIDEDDTVNPLLATSSSNEALNFTPWVNKTPLTVAPGLPLEIVMKLFKQMGPRVILVEQYGALVGLITVKDVLRFTASSEHSNSTASVWNDPGALNSVLEEAWNWASEVVNRFAGWGRRLIRR